MDENIFLQLQTVFSLKLPQPNPKLEDFITEKIAKFNINLSSVNFRIIFHNDVKESLENSEKVAEIHDKNEESQLDICNQKKELIINSFLLKIADRLELLSFLNANLKQNIDSTTNKIFFSTLFLQSFSSLFFIDFNELSNEYLSNFFTTKQFYLFIQSLWQSVDLNRDIYEIAYQSYAIFYDKFSQITEFNDTFLDILNQTNDFLMITKQISFSFLPCLVDVSLQLLHFSEKSTNEEEKAVNPKISSHFNNVSDVLSLQTTIDEQGQKFTNEEITKISEFFKLSANFAIFYNFNEISQSIIKFCFELSLFSGIQFNQIVPLFENVIQQNEFGDLEIYEVDFKSISEFASKSISIFNSEIFSHKFESLFNILSQISDKKVLIPIVFSMTTDNILNGNLNDFLFLLLFINKKFVDDKDMVNFMKKPFGNSKNDCFSILVPESLYQNTIFDDINNKYLLLLKCVGIEIYQSLAKVNLKLYNSLFELFTALKNSEKSFTELLIISLPILMNNYLPDEFFKNLLFAFDKFSMYECIKATTDFLFEIFNSKTFLYSSLNSVEANLFLCQFLNQPSFEEVGKKFYKKLFEFLAETPQKAPYFEPLLNAVKQIKSRCHFFELFYEIIDSLQKSVLRFISKGILFELIQDTILNYTSENEVKDDDECFDIMFKLLEFYYFDNNSLFQLDWMLISDHIIKTRKNKLSTNMYNSILKILSGSPTFNGIRYKEPTPLIKIVLNSEEFSKEFLQKLYQAIMNNSVQLLAFYQFKIIKMLLDFIVETISHQNHLDNDDEIFDLIMKIVVLVNNFICDRETIEKFLSVFHHFDILNKVHYARIPNYHNYLEESMNENNLSPPYTLRFDSLTSSILLPSPPIDCFSLGLTLYVNLLIPVFKSMMSLISFISQNHFLNVYLFQKKIVISSNHYTRPVIIPLEIPKNEWFDLKIHFKSLGEIFVQLNNNQVISDSSQSSCTPFPSSPIETAIMLKATMTESHLKNIEGLLTKILIYVGPFKQSFFAGDINDSSLFALFTPRFSDSKNHLKNLAYNYVPPFLESTSETPSTIVHNENSDAVYCANCESYLPNFANVFTSFSGLVDFVLFFSHKGIDVDIIQNLFTTLKFLLKDSNDLQKQMFEINGFYLITYFIKDIDPNSLTVEFWDNIIEFEKIITNMEVMKNYFDALLLSFKPYLDSNESVLFKVMKKWSQIEPNFFLSCITFPLFCQIIYHQFHQRKVSNNIKTLLIQIMVNVSRLFGQKEMSLLCELIGKMSVDDLESAMTMFQAVRAITTSYPKLHDVSINIMLNDERLMHSKQPEILCAILQLFAQRNLKYLALLLKTQMAIPRNYSEIDHFLTHFCGVFTGKSFKNLDNINEIEFSDHTIYLPVLPFILSFSFQSSSNQIGKVTKFLVKILSDPICIQYVASSINPLALFLLISFAIVLSSDLMKFLIDIISANIDLFADAYQIIDILSDQMNQGFHDYQSAIACSVILKVIEFNGRKKSKENQDQDESIDVPKMIDVIINSICFGINRSVFDFAKCSSVFLHKEKGTRRSSSYVKKPAIKKSDLSPNMDSIPSLKPNPNSENAFPKLKTNSNSENSFPKLTVNLENENSFPKLNVNPDNEKSLPKININENNFKVVSDMKSSNSDNNNDSDQSTQSIEQLINSTSLESMSTIPSFPHSVSLDLSRSISPRDRRSSLVHQQSSELLYSLSFFIRKKFVLNQIFEKLKENKFKHKRNSFGFIYKNKDVWADMKTAELLMTFLDESSLPPETSAQLCVMLSFLCHKQLFSSKKIDYMLNQVAEKYDVNDSFLYPLLNEVSMHINDFKNARFFLLKFESVLSQSTKLYEESTNVMRQFVNSLHPISNVSEKMAQLFGFEMEEIQIMDIDSYFLDLKQKELTRNNIRERMYRKLRPIYTESTRRFNIIDNHFRPFLLTNTEQLNYKILDSPQVQEHFAQHEIWSAKCQRVKLYTKIPGDFIITKDGIRFSTTKGKSLFILKTSVRCIFWNYYHHLPNSFTFTTLKGKTFLFRFITQCIDNDNDDDDKENERFMNERKIYLKEGDSTVIYVQTATREDVISNLKKIELTNCVFFQDSEPSTEIERLNLTQQWRTREISNFDYILWLNMLSGRSFLDIESYPIFPILFISDEDQSLVRDLSKTVSLSLSSSNNHKLRERKLSDLDPYKTFLFSKTSSTPEIIKRFLYSIEQFRVGDNSQIGFEDKNDDSEYNLPTKSSGINSKSCEDLKNVKSSFLPFSSYSQIIDEIKNGNLHCELPPEFFFMPEIFSNWTEFPKFAPNASTFVMKNLETLESEEVSLSIHKWIDMIWGVSQNFNCFIDPDLSPNVWSFNQKKKKNEEENKTKKKRKRWLKNSLNETKPADRSNSKKNDQDIERNKKIHEKLSKNGQIPVKLFAGPHPARGTCNIIQTKHTSFDMSTEPYVRSIGVRQTSNKMNEFEIFLFHPNECVTKFECRSTKISRGIKIPYDFRHFQHVSFSGSFLCFVILGTKTLFGFDFDKKELLIGDESPHLKQISCIDTSSSALYFVSGSSDSSIVTWTISDDQNVDKNVKTAKQPPFLNGVINPFSGKLSDELPASKRITPFRTLTAHRRPIVKVKIHDEMRILLAIDDVGVLSISVFPYLKLIKTIDTKITECEGILMTRNSLVCFKGREAFNFTANGTKNGSRKFNFDIVCVESIESRTRTDVIAISTATNEIISINSISLKAISILEHQTACITMMKYNAEIDALICYTESKKIIIVPISH